MAISNDDMVKHIAEVNVKLEYISKSVDSITTKLPDLATKEDITREIERHDKTCPAKSAVEKIDEKLSYSIWPKTVKDWVHIVVLVIAIVTGLGSWLTFAASKEITQVEVSNGPQVK